LICVQRNDLFYNIQKCFYLPNKKIIIFVSYFNFIMSIIGNIIWFLFGGLMIALEYLVAGLIFCVTIIGIPWGIKCFHLAILALWPFDRKIVSSKQSGGCLNILMNIIWIFIGGIWICLSHLLWGVILCITIIGIPFGRQHFKMAEFALTPFGKEIV